MDFAQAHWLGLLITAFVCWGCVLVLQLRNMRDIGMLALFPQSFLSRFGPVFFFGLGGCGFFVVAIIGAVASIVK